MALGIRAEAADPQPYTVSIAPTANAELDTALNDVSTLVSLRERAPVGPMALIARAEADINRLLAALQSFGHYGGQVAMRIAGMAIDDPALPARLDAMPASTPVVVEIRVTPGPVYRLGRIGLPQGLPQAARQRLELTPGAPAVARDIVAARDRMVDALRAEGHALARAESPEAVVDHTARTLDVTFAIDPGPRLDVGRIDVTGLENVREDFVRRRLRIAEGERYSPQRIEEARRDLVSVGVFSSVRIRAADRPEPEGRLPLTVETTERPPRAIRFTASYATDEGVGAAASWTHRNLFGRAEQLTLSAELTRLLDDGSGALGYRVSAQFRKPDIFMRDLALRVGLIAVSESLEAYDRVAATALVGLERRLSPELTLTIGLEAEQSRITEPGLASRNYTLLGLPVGAVWDTTGSPLDPVRGYRVNAVATPLMSLAGSGGTFGTARVAGSTYFDLSGEGRSVIALRGLLGGLIGAETDDIPNDRRFYGGGGGSVRGYAFQAVGPRNARGKPAGGRNVVEAAVELRQRIGESWGFAAFVDTGRVGGRSGGETTRLAVGAGLGVRYYTAIGPIRADVAVPLNRRSGDDAWQLYIGIGQSF